MRNEQVVSSQELPYDNQYLTHPAHQGIFNVFGFEWHTDPDEIVARTQFLAKGDPRQPVHTVEISPRQDQEARVFFGQLNMLGERQAPQGEYGAVIVPGGQIDSNNDRIAFAFEQLSRSEVHLNPNAPIIIQGGARLSFSNELTRVGQEQHGLQHVPQPAVLRSALELTPAEIDETHQLAMMLYKHVGELAISQIGLAQAGQRIDSVVNDYVFRTQQFAQNPIILQHSRPVNRPLGAPRHTTTSCAEDWLRSRYAPAEGARVLTVLNTPYIDRMALDIRAAVARLGRNVEIVPVGSVLKTADTRMLLGEWARRLYAENQRARTTA